MNIIKQRGYLRKLCVHLPSPVNDYQRWEELGNHNKKRLNRPQGCGQCCHTRNPDHRVMNIIKPGGGGGVGLETLYVHLPSPVNDYQRWEELGNHNQDSIDHKGVVNAAKPIIPTTGS